MTIQKLTVPGLSDDENRTLNGLLEQLDDRAPRNLRRASIYDGRRARTAVGGVIPPSYEQLGLVLGWCAKGVDGLARRINLDRFAWDGGDLDSLGMQELQDSNFLLSEISQGETDSLINGVSFLVTTRGDVEAGEPKVLVHARDGLNATGEWSARTRSLTSFVSVTSRSEGNAVTGFVLYLPNVTISGDKTDGSWKVDRSEHLFGVPVDPLVYRPRSSKRMGRSRMTRPAISHQEAAIRALVRIEAHMDIYAIPKMMILGGNSSVFKDERGNLKPSWRFVMGRVLGIPDDDEADDPQNARADVKQFAAESPAPHLSQLNALAKLEAREFDLPDQDFALTDMANPTSEGSYVQGRDSLIAEAEGAMEDWSVSIRRTVTRALAMQNDEPSVPANWSGIVPKWRSPLYLSRAAAADAGAKQLAAVPWLADTRVGLELIGLDEGQIKEALAQKQRDAGRTLVAALTQRAANQPAPVAGGNGA